MVEFLTGQQKKYFWQKRRGATVEIVVSYPVAATYSTGFSLASIWDWDIKLHQAFTGINFSKVSEVASFDSSVTSWKSY